MSTAVISEEQVCQLKSALSRCECPRCVEVRSRAIYRPASLSWRRGGKMANQGCEWHQSKTAIHWDWRDPNHINSLILITCRECRHDSFVRKQVILRFWKGERCWKGFCSSCTGRMPMSGRFSGNEYKNDFGAKIDLTRPHRRNYRWVTCPNYATCKGVEERRVDKYNIDTQPFFCRKCLNEKRSGMMKAAQAFLKGGAEKRRRGRQEGTTYVDLAAFFVSLRDAVDKLWGQTASIDKITYDAVARVFQRNGENIGGDAVRKRFEKCETHLKWRDFIVSRVSQNGN